MARMIELARTLSSKPSGKIWLDNVRFFPLLYDNFETGDFSLNKWRQTGDGAPWVISDEYAHSGRFSAHTGSTIEHPSGRSNLQLAVDM